MSKRFDRSPGLSLLLLSGCLLLQAQHVPIRYEPAGDIEDYTFARALCLFQDHRELIWFGTCAGLDRWDGSRIHSYPYAPFDSQGMTLRRISCITGDFRKTLWLLGDGLLKFDLEFETFTPVSLNTNGTVFDFNIATYDPSGFLWLGSGSGFYKYFPGTDSIYRVPVVESSQGPPPSYQILAIEKDSTGRIWAVDRLNGIYYSNPYDDRFRKLSTDATGPAARGIRYVDLSVAPDGNFWILGEGYELIRFNPYSGDIDLVYKVPLEGNSPNMRGAIEVDCQGKVWFGIDRGLMLFDPVAESLLELDPPEEPALIMDLIEDAQGNIIIATSEGVKIADMEGSLLMTIPFNEFLLHKGDDWITNIVKDGQTYWVGTYSSGLIRYDPAPNGVIFYKSGDQPGALSSSSVFKILKDREERIWVMAGQKGILHRYDPRMNGFERMDLNGSRFITRDDRGYFWICAVDRLIRFDPITLDTTAFRFKIPLPLEELRGELDLNPFIVDRNGFFWFGQQDGGLYRIDAEEGNWTHYSYDRSNPAGLPDPHIKAIYCDSNDRIWLSTPAGLSQVRHSFSDTAISFDNHYIHESRLGKPIRIDEDRNGNLWIGTYTGVNILKPDGTIESYTYKDGLPDSPRKIWALNSNPDGSMCMGTIDLVVMTPEYLRPNEAIPPIVFTGLRIDRIDDEPVIPGKGSPLKRSMLFTDRIDLKYDHNFILLEFAALNFRHPQKNQYRYFMQGVDKDTVYSGNEGYAEYTDLTPGNYKFWVTGSNDTGLWNPSGRTILIRVRPPWHRSAAALTAYCLLLIVILNAFLGFRTARLKKEKTRLKKEVDHRTKEIQRKNEKIVELDNLKTLFFNNISHELRTLLTAVKTPLEAIMEEEKVSRTGRRGLEVLYRNFSRLMLLVNQLLDISRIDRRRMKLFLNRQNLSDFLRTVALSYASLAESKGIYYRYYLPSADHIDWFDPDKIEKVISNLLSNAFKFTAEGGKVELLLCHVAQFNGMGNILEIKVKDSGSGIAPEEQAKIFDRFYQAEAKMNTKGEGTGIGLALTHDLVELMHGRIEVQSKPGEGSTFCVHIPLGKDHLKEGEFTICEVDHEVETVPAEKSHHVAPGAEKSKIEPGHKHLSNSKPSILIVEDNPDILWLLSDKMQAEFSVFEAVDGSAGLKIAREHMPDVVVTDLMMPRMDGFELCNKLKNDIRTSHIPVIMLTAKTELTDKIYGLKIGADDYITKPFEIMEVLVRSRNLIEQRKRLRDKYMNEITMDPREVVVTSVDEKFLSQVMEIINNHMGDEDFDVSALCKDLNMSRSTLFRKLEALTNQSPVEFIRTMRLKRAAYLFSRKFGNVSEVALEVGFNNPSYFSRMFRKTFSTTPSLFMKSVKGYKADSFYPA